MKSNGNSLILLTWLYSQGYNIYVTYRASQILRAATDGCRSRPWLTGLPTSGSAY